MVTKSTLQVLYVHCSVQVKEVDLNVSFSLEKCYLTSKASPNIPLAI